MDLKKDKKFIVDEEGSGLVLTLLVLLVLSVLGASLGVATIGGYRLSDVSKNDASAYYIAEAGAERAYNEIQQQVLDAYDISKTETDFDNRVEQIVKSFNDGNKVYEDFNWQNGIQPKAIIETDFDKSIIYSTGVIGNQKREVDKAFSVNWKEKNTSVHMPIITYGTSVIIDSEIKFLDGVLKGNVHINSIVDESVNIGWVNMSEATLYHSNKTTSDKILKHPDWFTSLPRFESRTENINFDIFRNLIHQFSEPATVNKLPNLRMDSQLKVPEAYKRILTSYEDKKNKAQSYVLTLNSDLYIPKIESFSGVHFDIVVGSNDYTLVVDELNLRSNEIKIIGDGTLNIVVRQSINIEESGAFNPKNESKHLNLMYFGTDEFKFSGWTKEFNGNVLIRNANVFMPSTLFGGVLLTGGQQVRIQGGSSLVNIVLIAPDAEVIISGGVKVSGTVIANKMNLSGGSKLVYAEVDMTGFHYVSTDDSEIDSKEVINDKPAVEINKR